MLFQFEAVAQELITASNNNISRIIHITEVLSTIVTASILTDGAASSNPGFYTLPFVEQTFGNARNASGAIAVGYLPIVTSQNLATWNTYAENNQGWIRESVSGSLMDPIFPVVWDSTVECELPDNVTRIAGTASDGPFAPVWTISPVIAGLINKDMFAHGEQLEQGLVAIEAIGRPLILESCSLGRWFDAPSRSVVEDDSVAILAYPVYGSFSLSANNTVGYMIQVLPWKTFWADIMPQNTPPVTIHLESTCGRYSIYQITGPDVKLLSKGQETTERYQHLVVTEVFADFVNSPDLVDQSICIYTVNIYPTQTFAEVYDSQDPVTYALVVVGIFTVTIILFLTFDAINTRERNAVLATAKKQKAIVSSLFPESIQAKMMEDEDAVSLSKKRKAGLKSYLNNDDLMADLGGRTKKRGELQQKSKPIADLFPESKSVYESHVRISFGQPITAFSLSVIASIMFGDISGFTAWSSTREPSQVFILLETIYQYVPMCWSLAPTSV
jgi:hypothetical protein